MWLHRAITAVTVKSLRGGGGGHHPLWSPKGPKERTCSSVCRSISFVMVCNIGTDWEQVPQERAKGSRGRPRAGGQGSLDGARAQGEEPLSSRRGKRMMTLIRKIQEIERRTDGMG